jgi:hypothetical protein
VPKVRQVKLSEVLYAVKWYLRSGSHGLGTNGPPGAAKYRCRVVVQAGPAWAYRERREDLWNTLKLPRVIHDYRNSGYEPLKAMWVNVTREIERRVNEGRAEGDRLGVYHPHGNALLTCRLCGGRFVGHGLRRYCSPACCAKRPRGKRPSKAKPVTEAICVVCGRGFDRKRVDARTCSVRCRVAAHRAKPK